MWGAPGVTMKRALSNGKSNWGPGGTPTAVDVQRVGILRNLRLLTDGTTTLTPGTGTVTRDFKGSQNVYKLLTVSPNQQAPFYRTSGFGNGLTYFARQLEFDDIAYDTIVATTGNANPTSDVFSGGSTSSGDWRTYHEIPVGQLIKSLGTEVGLWPLENPAVQLQLEYTPSSVATASPFDVGNTVAGLQPYLLTGNATATIASPVIDVRRELYEVPESDADDPPYSYVVSWLEEKPQGANVNGASFAEWKATPLSGVILRLITYITDGGTAGVADSKLTGSNALALLFGADTQKFAYNGQAVKTMMKNYYGSLPPTGCFIFDFMGKDLTLADTIDTYTVPEVRLDYNFSSALGGSNSDIFVIREMLVPIEIQGR